MSETEKKTKFPERINEEPLRVLLKQAVIEHKAVLEYLKDK